MKTKKIITLCLLLLLCLGLGAGVSLSMGNTQDIAVCAAQEETQPKTQSMSIGVNAYELEDNTGYIQSEDKRVSSSNHPLKNNLVNISVFTQSDIQVPVIEKGKISGYDAYGVTGNSVALKLSYNFSNPESLRTNRFYDYNDKCYKTRVYSISDDTAQNVGDIERLGIVGTGAFIFQKKSDANGQWEWTTKDGETKKSLHTVDFTEVVPLSDYYKTEKYDLYTPSGKDLSSGVFIKLTFAYELKITTSWEYTNWLGITKTKSETEYINMLESAEFYLAQNSGAVLFHNASTFGKTGDEEGSGAISIEDFETILNGDVTLNGFRLDTMGVETYDIKYTFNGAEEHTAFDGQVFLEQGRYDFVINRQLGASIRHTVFVDRREVNDAVVGYFGQSLFTPDSKRVYTTGEYPAYLAGHATWHLNATDGTVAPVVGKLYKIIEDGEEEWVYDIEQSRDSDYKTKALEKTIYEPGIYKAEFWGNPRYLHTEELSGDLYHFTFRFEIVDEDTPVEPSINEAYLNGLYGFSDMQSKYYAVVLPTKGEGNAIFAFSDFSGAYDFAYENERAKIIKNQNKYIYGGKTYDTQKDLLAEVDKVVKTLIVERYFDSTNPESYQTADVADDKILDMNFSKDVIVFTNDTEQSYMKAGLPSLNGRKYRYISPDTGEIEEGVMNFAFIKVADFESDSVTLVHKASQKTYEIVYGVSVEYQLVLANAPSGVYTVRETNSNNATCEYDTVYIRPGEMTGTATFSLFKNGRFIEKTFGRNSTVTETGLSGFILKSLTNELDLYSIVKINHDGEVSIYNFDEVSEMWFADGGVYEFTLADRQGNTVEFSLIISDPVGYADVYLQLEQEDDEITKYFHVFVGQEIQLPTPTLESDLYVFDGWLYNDELITDNVFIPQTGGDLYVWQQITQKYTYLDFDTDGGNYIERMKVEIGEPIQLPEAVKAGWTFGGWEYGGTVYNGEYIPTSASPTFVAKWHYVSSEIALYDGNLTQTIEARVGDKVILPFPTRTGYTFFGWREKLSDGSNKVYYGQITALANIEYLRLDALWIRQSAQDEDSLPNGNGGRTMIHFIDEDLLSADSLQVAPGSVISLPKVTRAGFVFVGWIWKTTSTSGKIYCDSTMTVPEDAGGKIVLNALWIARGTTSPQSADIEVEKLSGLFSSMPIASEVAVGGFISMLGFIFAISTVYLVRQKREAFNNGEMKSLSTAYAREMFSDKEEIGQNKLRKYGAVTLFTAFLLVVVITFISAFGGWGDLGVFNRINNKVDVVPVQSESVSDNNVLANTFTLDNFGVENTQSDEVKPNKEEVLDNIRESGITDEFDLTEDELFLYSMIMIDLFSLGQVVFPAVATLPNNNRVLGFGYSDFENTYNSNNNTNQNIYLGSGFVALLRQPKISNSDIENGVYLELAYEKSNLMSKEELSKSEEVGYIISYFESYGPCHYIANGKYVTYSLDKWVIEYDIVDAEQAVYQEKNGALYDYDLGRYVYDPELGKEADIKATSLNTMLDPAIAKGEYEKYIADQTANGFTVDTLNFVYISYTALEAYQQSEQDESLLGIDVQEFYDLEKTLGNNEYYTVDAEGNLTKLEFPHEEEDKASWLDRLAGAVVAIGMIIVGVIIVAAVSVVSCGAATTAAPYIMGAFIGAGMEVFMQTVVQGKKLDQVNWMRVGVAAVSGVLSAIPGVGWFGAGLIDGLTEAAMTWAEGGSIEDILKSFTVGFATGVLIHGVGKALGKMKFCFVAGTVVLMAGGAVKCIEDVRVGDKVKSYNPATGKVSEKRVLQTFENEVDELVTVSTSDGQQVTATPGHKFYANNDWVSAEDLRAGDVLVNVNGKKVIVEQVQHELLDSPVKVYNFEVADNHTYFVGDGDGMAVHNSACNNIQKRVKGEVGKYKNVRVEAELGGSGFLNVHVHADKKKFMYDNVNKVFKDAPDVLNTNSKVIESLNKAIKEALKRGWKFK